MDLKQCIVGKEKVLSAGHHLSFVIARSLGQNACITGVEGRVQKWNERTYLLFYKVCHMSVRSQFIGEEDAEFRGRR